MPRKPQPEAQEPSRKAQAGSKTSSRKAQVERKAPAKKTKRGPARKPKTEWVGGRVQMPLAAEEGDSDRPVVEVWMELPAGAVVGLEVVQPGEKPHLGRALEIAMASPDLGEPRRPDAIRVETGKLADEVRRVMGDFPIQVAPTPEIDDVVAAMADAILKASETSYLGGDVPEEAVAEFFRMTALLVSVRPWDSVHDEQLIHVDIPGLGIDGACLSLLSQEGGRGFMLFPTLADLLALGQALMDEEDPADFDGCLSLTLESPDEILEPILEEAAEHGWEFPAPDLFPVLQFLDEDGNQCLPAAPDFETATAVGYALCSLVSRGGKEASALAQETCKPFSVTLTDENGLDVRLSAPYEAFAEEE